MKKCLRPAVLASVFLLCVVSLQAQTLPRTQERFRIRYVINRPEVDTSFIDNAARISDLRDFLQRAARDTFMHIVEIEFRGTASPDGSYEFNRWLSENRLRAFKELIGEYISIPDSIITANVSEIPWDEFRRKVDESEIAHREEVLSIIDEGARIVPWFNNRHIDARLLKLKKIYGGSVWNELKEPILRDLRYGQAVIDYYRMRPRLIDQVACDLSINLPPPIAQIEAVPVPTVSWTPRWYLKTNLAGLALGSANLGAEVDIARHWSVALSASYCAWDYFTPTLKFRNLSARPSLRWWPFLKYDGSCYRNDGFFVGAHFGLAYYNLAFNSDYRYQDRFGTTPAWGGGLDAGYRWSISRNQRWHLELALGAGAFHTDYVIFDNPRDVKEGTLVGQGKKLYIGPDCVSATLSYSFDMERFTRTYKKGGRR